MNEKSPSQLNEVQLLTEWMRKQKVAEFVWEKGTSKLHVKFSANSWMEWEPLQTKSNGLDLETDHVVTWSGE